MERKVPHFSKQFCKDIQKQAELEYFYWASAFKDDLLPHADTLKLKFIDSKRVEINQYLEESDYRMWFPAREVKMNLTACLEVYFRGNWMSQAIGVKYNPSMAMGNYKYNSITNKITVKPISKSSLTDSNFNFGLLDYFKPLIQYLTWHQMRDELNEMETAIRKKKKIHPRSILQKWNDQKEDYLEETRTENFHSRKFLQIFNEGGYDLFCYLNMEYSKSNSTPKAKYSNIFHFLKYEQLIICTQLEYIEFIKTEMGENMSKILPQNGKYTDTISPLLTRLKSDFEKEQKLNKNEYFLNKS